MSSDLRSVLTQFRDAAKTEREKGTYFERLAVAFIKNDPGMAQEYEDAWLYSDWAKANGQIAKDVGIDAVAKVRDGGLCAIQCKFYAANHTLAQNDLAGFIAASATGQFERRLFVDTTTVPLSNNLEAMISSQQVPTTRIGLDRLEQSPIDWAAFLFQEKVVVAAKKEPRPHQVDAIEAVKEGFGEHDRGKLILACGTGKTFTALKIAESMVGPGKSVLFLVPSLSLMSQSVREWTIDSTTPLRSFAVCSDAQVGKRRRGDDDVAEIEVHDLDYPATTNPAKLARKAAVPAPDRMTAVFATYQSIQVLADAQALHGLQEFDLIVCDEAHRTTGATFPGEDQSNFVKVHDQAFLKGRKRLYMTATPRVFGDVVRAKANEASVELCSMDDETLYGPNFFTRGFGWAVENQLLTDYKVIVLAVDEGMVSASIQKRLADAQNELKLDDATKIVGCYKALTKAGLKEDVASDPDPMHRGLAFCRDIASSKLICEEFGAVIRDYLASDEGQEVEEGRKPLGCELQHVDGTFNAKARTARLDWLKAEGGEDTCRILTNARCLSEGVDVPSLDSILFLHPRKSQIDVVQSVGRVMRRAEGKRMGYVILPIGVPAGMSPEEALNDNERYRVVWQILNALRSHDERFDATINRMDLGADVSGQIEVIAVSNKLPTKKDASKVKSNIGYGSAAVDDDDDSAKREHQGGVAEAQTEFVFDEFARAIMAKIVRKCGRRDYWENWAGDIAEIAKTHITRITAIVAKEGSKGQAAFQSFLAEIRDDLNDSITEPEAIEMLAQHIITKPVFEALFSDHSFASNNPVSVAMQSVLDVLEEQNLEKEAESLQRFYESVRRRASGIDTAEAKQKIVVELYDKFFRTAFPRMTAKLGIVYTPVEIVDFIIRSVDEVLRSEFGQTLGSPGVHIIDPFTGTGTFITRLLQSGLISPEELAHKYREELHANEIVLLAYYIAAINIEAVHASIADAYEPFKGICLTDTFQLWEKDDLISGMMADNGTRRTRQKSLPLKVIIGNPPYSVGQASANDDNQNIDYPHLDARIDTTYANASDATLKSKLYNSYVRAIRWASDRVGETGGIVAYVADAGWITANGMDGLRKCVGEEFSEVFVFHLRGNARTKGEQRRRERDNVFGQGSRQPIAILVMVKKPTENGLARIRYHDIGDYLTQAEKLKRIDDFGSLSGIGAAGAWVEITPNEHHDWLDQRDSRFDDFIALGSKSKRQERCVFRTYSLGVVTNRDAWCINSSKKIVAQNIKKTIGTFSEEARRLAELDRSFGSKKEREKFVDGFVTKDPARISWTRGLKLGLARGDSLQFDEGKLTRCMNRPFSKQWLYFDRQLNEMVLQIPKLFPGASAKNRVIGLSAVGGGRGGFSVLMTDVVPTLHMADTDGAQYFPLYTFDSTPSADGDLFSTVNGCTQEIAPRSAIAEEIVEEFRVTYGEDELSGEDIFYYTYAMLNSEEYRDRFRDNILKQLPRIPLMKREADFRTFVQAGRALADLHVDYELAEPYPVTIKEGDPCLAVIDDADAFYRVEKMRFAGKRGQIDKSTVIYNSNITMTRIPLNAYDYVVNGKSALEWIMERQSVKVDKDSGIVNDANRYALETVGDPSYPLKLFQRIITVSLETMKIIRALPRLDIAEMSVTGSVLQTLPAVLELPPLETMPGGIWAWPASTQPHERLRYAAQYVLWQMDPVIDGVSARFVIASLAEPALLTRWLSDEERRQWLRLAGPEARPVDGVLRLRPAISGAWRSLFEVLVTSGQLKELADGAWSRGDHFNATGLQAGSADAQRAAFAIRAARSIDIAEVAAAAAPEDNVIWTRFGGAQSG